MLLSLTMPKVTVGKTAHGKAGNSDATPGKVNIMLASAAACSGGDTVASFRKSRTHPPTCKGDAVLRSRKWLNAM